MLGGGGDMSVLARFASIDRKPASIDLFLASVEIDPLNVTFSNAEAYRKDGLPLKCALMCKHRGNYIHADGYGLASGDAFLNAIEALERTVGDGWRS